jgi:hypothetical protein|nr:MAG TPA: Protein involved in gliding motility 9 Secretion System Type.5A [Crassvirales sp.]
MKKLLLLCASLLCLNSCDDANDTFKQNFNEVIVGYWDINSPKGYIEFYPDNLFIMNDSIYGNYNFPSEQTNKADIYWESDSGNSGEGVLELKNYIGSYTNIMVTGLPYRELETVILTKKP